MDNGSGSALLLDMAASFKKNPETIRRSILLVLVTGEEKGLLGSKYFSAHPTVPPKSIVADVNVDMFLPIVPLKRLTVEGLNESDLGDRAREVAESLGVKGAARSRAAAQSLRPQRSVQFHSPRCALGGHGRRSRPRFAGAEEVVQRLADLALPRPLRRREPTRRPCRRRQLRRRSSEPCSSTSPMTTIARSGSQTASSGVMQCKHWVHPWVEAIRRRRASARPGLRSD